MDTIQGRQGKLCQRAEPGCAKDSNWGHKYYEIPIWENRLRIRFEIEHQAIGVRGSYGDIAIDDIIVDEGKCIQSVCFQTSPCSNVKLIFSMYHKNVLCHFDQKRKLCLKNSILGSGNA